MNRRSYLFVLVAVSACLVGWVGNAYGTTTSIPTGTSFTLNLNNQNYTPSATCKGGLTPGGTTLQPLVYLPPQNSQTQNIENALNAQRAGTELNGHPLFYNYSVATSSLTGTMTIDYYKAADFEVGPTCVHGAAIVAYYDGADWSSLGLNWVQVFTETGGAVNSPYAYTVDGSSSATPAYYPPGTRSPDATYTLQSGHDGTFTDFPRRPHVEAQTWSGGWTGYLFLASFGQINKVVTNPDPLASSYYYTQDVVIYDGVQWGWDGKCTPEPVTLLAVGLALAGLVPYVRRRLKAA